MLSCEPAKPEDLDPIFRLNKDLIDLYEDLSTIDYPKVLQWVRRNLEQNLSSFTRVLWNGELAGYYCLTSSEEKTELDSFFILPPFRGKGIGMQILQKCQSENAPLFLYVFKRNTRAIALYQRMGFEITKEVGKTRCIMEYSQNIE